MEQYSEPEKEVIRQQLKTGNAEMRDAIRAKFTPEFVDLVREFLNMRDWNTDEYKLGFEAGYAAATRHALRLMGLGAE
jgi:hypothetical protein